MTEATPLRGRPRSLVARRAILDAAFTVLVERGYAGMAIEAVADAAGVGKTTIYRSWAGKADLAVDAFFEATREALAFPETGLAREDFRRQILELAALLRGARGQALAAMLGGARTDPDLARALGARWLEPRRRWGVERMARAIAAGECRDGVGAQAALGVLYGPLYAPLLFGQGVPSEVQVGEYLAIAFAGIFR